MVGCSRKQQILHTTETNASSTSLTPSSITSVKYSGALLELFFHDTNLGELIMPNAHNHVTCCHSLQIVVRVTLNLLAMSTMAPLSK